MIDYTSKIILLSPVGGQAMHGIVEYFRDKRAKVIGIDRNPEAIGKHFVDKFFVVPNVTDSAYMDSILKIIVENKVNIFISWLDSEIIFWNEKFYSTEISKKIIGIHTFNFRSDIMNFYDKFKFSSLFVNLGFCFPKTSLLSEDKNLIDISFPAIVKPRVCTGSKNVFIVEKPESLDYYLDLIRDKFVDINKFLIQEYISGIEYTVDFFAIKGRVINLVIRKRIEHRGVSLIGEIAYNDDIEHTVNKFSSQFNIDGLNNIQVIESEGRIFITDFNPRPSGTIMLSINAGVDFLNNVIEKKENKKITCYGRPKRIKMARYLCELYYE